MLMKNALCFIVGYLVAMETSVTLFLSMHFCKVHGIGAINVSIPILRSIGTKLTNLENMQNSYVLFDVT